MNWMQPTPNRYKPNMRWRCWWLNSLQKMQKLSIKEIQGSRLTRQDPFLIKLQNKPFSQCSNPFSRCKAWSATVFRNSSWRLPRLRRMSRKSVRLWHRQCGNWKQGTRTQNLVPRRTAFRAKWRARTKSFQGVSVPGFTKMDTEDQEAIKRSLSNGITEKRRLAKKCKQEGKVCNLLRLWVWTQLVAVPCYLALSRIGESDHPGPACATAKLFGDQFGATGQWATNLTSKCEVKLTPLLAQDGECRQIFSERFGKESYPYTSSVSQDIQGTHSHMDRLSLLVSPEHEGDFVHIQRFSDYPFLVRVGGECDESRHVSAQMQICDGSGKERKTPFCHHAKRGGRKHTGKKRKLGIAEGGE